MSDSRKIHDSRGLEYCLGIISLKSKNITKSRKPVGFLWIATGTDKYLFQLTKLTYTFGEDEVSNVNLS